jgi:hypothetical protein
MDMTRKALECALDIRKFEIELYWKRAAYFWAVIALAFTGYFSILGAEHMKCDDKFYYAFVISCIGFVFSVAWLFVSRGSKFWQENWEHHVDFLEDNVIGPLYKTVLFKKKLNPFKITDPMKISVSKVNQCCCFFVIIIWIILAINALPFDYLAVIGFVFNKYFLVSLVALLAVLGMYFFSQSSIKWSKECDMNEDLTIAKRKAGRAESQYTVSSH